MYTCILCRHGEIDNPKRVYYGRSLDLSLHTRGRRTVAVLAKKIQQKKILVSVIYTSPLKRAKETAEILAQKLAVPIVIHNSLIDVDIPALAGKSLAIRQGLLVRQRDEYAGSWVRKGNEARAAIAQRMVEAFQEIRNQNTDGIPLIVSHGDPLILLLYALENPGKRMLPIGKLIRQGYIIEKGQGLFVHLNRQWKILKKEIIK